MDAAYGSSDKWDAIAIRTGGLSAVKSRVILRILEQVKERHGEYSLDHLFAASVHDAMTEMLSFQGVGPKTASCVLLFCLKKENFPVDTHVYRITGLLGWRPSHASREETYAHLDVKIPAAEKYPLHVLLIAHGKQCAECRAGGKNLGKCALRRAFKRVKSGELKEEGIKEENLKTDEGIKQEE
ncbi:DNA glycosylase [Stachybotrys elegans]|uniref:DNA glycosylase n=1 Tax=Stachybotrys elegans TaxID=80388 RepID=A0A8K0WLY9_9HYPO|nr:DNA glycosylase [Stachybotrys elegans]